MNNTIELLAPAKNALIGMEAILHGADAVYIGADRFGARKAAGNSLEDIEKLVQFAHFFHARVYVTVNTILLEDNIQEVEKLLWDLHAIGVDAIIAQDMGIFEMKLPPIAIHGSTQMDNRTVEKVQFLESIGVEQVVLARELSLETIKNIADNTHVRLEAFCHGALCVSYSGNCYAGQCLSARSANKGECPQICRLPFDLQDSEGHSLGKKHWLSLKDFYTLDKLEDLINAGVSAFKIEGRLKDAEYVKNTTAAYSRALNAIIAQRNDLRRLSDGRCEYTFTPDVRQSFNRGFCSYFLSGKRGEDITSFDTPKSKGEKIGTVVKKVGIAYQIKTAKELNNADGMSFFDANGALVGFKVNKVVGNLIYPFLNVEIPLGTTLYRNANEGFSRLLAKPSATRAIPITISLKDRTLQFSDSENTVSKHIDTPLELAQKDSTEYIKGQMSRLGGTQFVADEITVDTPYFIPASVLSSLRRALCEDLSAKRLASHPKASILPKKNSAPYPTFVDSYTNNISNSKAKAFYLRHGCNAQKEAFELTSDGSEVLMYCKHCIKYALGACPKEKTGVQLKEPLFLIYKNYYLRLIFDCHKCEMRVVKG